jgi:hypothetical protein
MDTLVSPSIAGGAPGKKKNPAPSARSKKLRLFPQYSETPCRWSLPGEKVFSKNVYYTSRRTKSNDI